LFKLKNNLGMRRNFNKCCLSSLLFLLFKMNSMAGTKQSFPKKERVASILLIFPATESDVKKYTQSSKIMILETASDYEEKTKPFIASKTVEGVPWILNILQGY